MEERHKTHLSLLIDDARADLSDPKIEEILRYLIDEIGKSIPRASIRDVLEGRDEQKNAGFPWTSYYVRRHTMYLSGFGNFGVPFEEWKELASKALDLLEEQLEKPMTPMEELDGYKDIRQMGREMSERFSEDPRFREAFRDPLSR